MHCCCSFSRVWDDKRIADFCNFFHVCDLCALVQLLISLALFTITCPFPWHNWTITLMTPISRSSSRCSSFSMMTLMCSASSAATKIMMLGQGGILTWSSSTLEPQWLRVLSGCITWSVDRVINFNFKSIVAACGLKKSMLRITSYEHCCRIRKVAGWVRSWTVTLSVQVPVSVMRCSPAVWIWGPSQAVLTFLNLAAKGPLSSWLLCWLEQWCFGHQSKR